MCSNTDELDAKICFEELVMFTQNETRAFGKIITRDTLIEDDLGVTGEDASDLIQSFAKKYKIDIPRFHFSKYFYDEPPMCLFDTDTKCPLTVGHLEQALINGVLNDNTINS